MARSTVVEEVIPLWADRHKRKIDLKALRALREARGWARERLAYELHVSSWTIYRWEAGKSKPTGLYLDAIVAFANETNAMMADGRLERYEFPAPVIGEVEPNGELRFDPTQHMIKVSGRDYLPVAIRLKMFRDENPDGMIMTELITHPMDLDVVIFKATISRGPTPSEGLATGWGMAEQGEFGDYLEKCETKAVGRALAALGYGTLSASDYEGHDMPIVDSPQQLRDVTTLGDVTIDKRGVQRLLQYRKEADVPETTLAEYMMSNLQEPVGGWADSLVGSLGQLTVDQAKEVAAWIREEQPAK